MAFDFPTSPTEGQVYAPVGGPPYVFIAGTWRIGVVRIADAPNDGLYYGEKNAAWAAVTEEAPDNANTYGRRGLAWAAQMLSVEGHLIELANIVTSRANLQVPCMPNTGGQSVVGGNTFFYTNSGQGMICPSGGSWFSAWQGFTTSQTLWSGVNVGLYAGNTTIVNGVTGVNFTGWLWRVL